MSQPLHIFTLANFNLQNFNAALKKEFNQVNIEAVELGQLFPHLLGLNITEKKQGIVICWITENDVTMADHLKINLAELILKIQHAYQYSIVILPSVSSPAFNLFQESDLRKKIYRLQIQLSEEASNHIALLDPTPWMIQQGNNAVSSPLWYLSKTPFHKNIFRLAANSCKDILNAVQGKSKKVLIVDLDDTLWGGIVGDDGIENLKIGGHDPLGESFADFQTWIQKIKSWGVLLCICSKNEESIALEVFEKHSGMVLKKEDFVTWKINWNDKAANIMEMVNGLNVGLDTVVFLDDNPVERDRVRTALPDVFVPDLPQDKMEYPAFIKSLACFDKASITEEDKNRTELYQQETERKNFETQFSHIDEWIDSLKIEIQFEELNELNLNRAEQLLNKTNQMNLRTRRLTKEALKNWAQQNNHWFYVVHVKDIFGDNGITGLLGFHQTDKGELLVDDFVMSCRVMGRKIEHQMLDFIQQKAKEINCSLVMEYLPTEKNKPMKDFVEKNL